MRRSFRSRFHSGSLASQFPFLPRPRIDPPKTPDIIEIRTGISITEAVQLLRAQNPKSKLQGGDRSSTIGTVTQTLRGLD